MSRHFYKPKFASHSFTNCTTYNTQSHRLGTFLLLITTGLFSNVLKRLSGEIKECGNTSDYLALDHKLVAKVKCIYATHFISTGVNSMCYKTKK